MLQVSKTACGKKDKKYIYTHTHIYMERKERKKNQKSSTAVTYLMVNLVRLNSLNVISSK